MSSDGEQPPKPSKRPRLIITDSDTSEESIVTRIHRKRRVYRVVSDAESTDDDDAVPKPVTRRRNFRVISDNESSFSSDSEAASSSQHANGSTSSEWQSDWESISEDSEPESVGNKRRSKNAKSTKAQKKVKSEEAASSMAGAESDTSDGQSEKCPICLLSFGNQEVATPSSCEHCFCFYCLMEWSKNINTCPVDRQTFTALHVRDKPGGKVTRQVPIEVKSNVEEQIQEDPTYCEVCHQCDREDRMLLCDGCDLGYHLECLNPPMNEVPLDEWFCPDCSRNSQDDAEVVDIDLDEISDLMAEARGLGLSYGRTRTGIPNEMSAHFGPHRLIPRTRQTERVRANIRADRNRTRDGRQAHESTFDPEQPSTSSSGMDSMSDFVRLERNSRMFGEATSAGVAGGPSSSRARKKSRRKTKKRTRGASGHQERMVREVRIREFDDNGDEREIVTYVNVAPSTTRRRKKRAKRSRKKRSTKRARTVSSMAAAMNTVKKRLVNTLGMVERNNRAILSGPDVKVRKQPSARGVLTDSRYRAGIAQVSLFGNDLGLDYSPPGSDDEIDSAMTGGSLVGTHRRTAISSTRRRFALKGLANPVLRTESTDSPADLIGSIIESQERWHSRKLKDVTLKADGTLLIEPAKENSHSINNNESPVKKRDETSEKTSGETPLDLSSVNPSDITQAPMYNSPRGGGGGGGNRGNFRGGYRDNSRQGQVGNQASYGGRDSYGGRHSYGGTGIRDFNRDFGGNYNPNFEHRGPPPFAGTPPFRNRMPMLFRPERRPDRPIFSPMDCHDRPPPPIHFGPQNHFPGPRIPLGPPPGLPPGLPPVIQQGIPSSLIRAPPPPPPPLPPPQTVAQEEQSCKLQEELGQSSERESAEPQSQPLVEAANSSSELETTNCLPRAPTPERPAAEDEDCDIYCDIEANTENQEEGQVCSDTSAALQPPPEPPSGLLDFEDTSKSDKDNDSDQDLVIDDTPKEERSSRSLNHDKYDPFTADSDTNDSDKDTDKPRKGKKNSKKDTSLDPPPMPPSFPSDKDTCNTSNPLLRLTAYDDDDDEDDSQDDCPNFSIYSSETMDVARHTEQELSQQIGPLEPPPLPPDIPDDDDVIVGDVQSCDLADIPEPSDPYVEALRKERQTLSRIPPKKISNDSRGKITFKIGNKFKINNKLSNLYDELDENIEVSIEQEKELEEKKNNAQQKIEKAKKPDTVAKNDEIFPSEEIRKSEVKEKTSDAPEEKKLGRWKSVDTKANDSDDEKKVEKELKEDSAEIKIDTTITTGKDDEEKRGDDAKQEKTDESKDVAHIPNDKSEENSKQASGASMVDLTEKSSDTIISMSESAQSSPVKSTPCEKMDASSTGEKEKTPTKLWRSLIRDRRASDVEKRSEEGSDEDESERKIAKIRKLRKRSSRVRRSSDGQSDTEDRSSENEGKDCAKNSCSSQEQARAGASSSFDVEDETENFPLEKETTEKRDKEEDEAWESDGAYTPCKDERPVKEKESRESLSPFESGLEPITPPKDRSNDDLDGCRTPAGYAGLGTEAISETDEAMNFEDEPSLVGRKDKDVEDGEIMEDKTSKKRKSTELEDGKRKKKKDKKDKSRETEKNKENISSENQVSWKKISKSTKDRQYREKDRRSRSRERDKGKPKKKLKETARKKEKRKELVRYDVRKVVAEKPARPRKDEYGRDIREYSRSRSRSRSLSRARSLSRDRRSRSYSRMRSRSPSRSRQRQRSWSRDRRSISKSRRSPSRRRSLSRSRRGKRSITPRRSVSKKRSISRRRSKSPTRRKRSLSGRRRRRSSSRKHRTRSRDRRKEKAKIKHKSRSRSRGRKRGSRSKSPKRISSKSRDKKHVKRKIVSRSRSKHRSPSRERDRNRNWNPMSEKPLERERFSREKEPNRDSWSAQWTPSWSRSNSPIVNQHDDLALSHKWSPPAALDGVNVPPKNLTVILTNKEAMKKKKKEKRRESKKARIESDRRRRAKRTRTPPPSKEVFASGDNILVSVCFNKENEAMQSSVPELPETIPLMPPMKRRRRDSVQPEPPKKSKKDKNKEKRPKSPKGKKEKKKKSKAAEIAATKKPVAVIDLDQSPFRQQTPSPRDIIVLSDDDDDDEKQPQELATPEQHPHPATPQHEQFVVSQGPKTPPEPQIKFSIGNKASNLRPSMMNPLHEQEEEEMEEEEMEEEEEEEEEEEIDQRVEEELEMRAQEELELRLKIGPNTPPEPPSSPPTSPDAYDPFDPTKSRSPTPTPSQDMTPNDDRDRAQRNPSPRKHDGDDENLNASETAQPQDPPASEKQPAEKPKIISMVTIKRASPNRDTSPVIDNQTEVIQVLESPPSKTQQSQQNVQTVVNPFATINPVLATVAAAVQRSAMFSASTPIPAQRNLQQPNRISPSTQIKQRTLERPQLPNLFANASKPTPIRVQKTLQSKNLSTVGQNGSDANLEMPMDSMLDMSSPYSPGSSLSDGIFDPPSPGNHNSSPINATNVNKIAPKSSKPTDKKDAFDILFGTSPAMKSKIRSKKTIEKDKRSTKSTNPKVGVRMDENQLQILDDLPSSAVEMQVKDKFLKKLNRQERVVEEVKLVLKPHYTKKHVTKEEYKDIMRKAVPKICHNKTGEINPKKIAQLIEAYVRKCRFGKKKKLLAASLNSSAKPVKPMKNLWS